MSNHSSFEIHSNGNTPSERATSKGGWKHFSTKWWIVTTLTIIVLLIIALILSFTTFRSPQENIESIWEHIDSAASTTDTRKKLTLDDILSGRLNGEGFNATWISDNQLFYQDIFGEPLLLNVSSNAGPKRLVTKLGLIPDSAFNYELSNDQKYLLVTYNYQKLWRHSYLAHYLIIDLEHQTAEPLVAPVSPSVTQHTPPDLLQLAIWAPKGNALAFVHLNEIYYRSSAVPRQQSVRVSPVGRPGMLFHGVTDWVYEEEVFSSQKGLWFSPDGLHLAFASFDDSHVGVVTLPYYGPPGSLQFQYPANVVVRYPKVGTANPNTTLSVVNLHLLKTIHVQSSNKSLTVLNSVLWSSPDTIIASWTNRVQNEGEILACKVTTNQNKSSLPCNMVMKLSQPEGWLDLLKPPLPSPDGKHLAIILPQMQNDFKGTYRHLTILPNITGEGVGQEAKVSEQLAKSVLTHGRRTVTNLLGWDQKTDYIYFEMTDENMPWRKRVYRISAFNKKTETDLECISCKITNSLSDDSIDENSNNTCTKASVQLSTNFSYSALQCEGPQLPNVHVYGNKDFDKILNWTDNKQLEEEVKKYALPNVFRVTIPLKDGFEAHAQLLLPPQLNPVEVPIRRYPLLVNVYGGPDSYQNSDSWEMNWSTYLASNLSIIVAAIDGRGSGLRSTETLFAVNRKLGTVEIQDQIDATKWLQENYKWIDKKRTAIWGWSYGGYASTAALMNTSNVFECAAAVAPVSDWINYDSIYTERYMGLPTPTDNMKGYLQASLLTRAEYLRGKTFLLIHGTLDDNVHFQQSMLLSRALEKADILFRQQTYPDEAHALSGIHPHLYHTLEHFLKEDCFDLED